MVRTLDPNLAAASSATSQQPAIACLIARSDPQFAAYQSATGTEYRSASCVAGDGSIVRAHIAQSGGASQPLAVPRIADPGQAAQWTTWTQLATGVNAPAGCTVAWMANAVFVIAQQYGGSYPVVFWTRSDYGQTWSAMCQFPATPVSPTSVRGIASAGNNDCFILYDVSGGVPIACSFYTGIWQQSTRAPLAAGAGLAVTAIPTTPTCDIAASDGQIINAYRLSTTWSSLPVIVPAAASGGPHRYPFLLQLNGGYLLCNNEIDSGTVTSLVYSRPRLLFSRDLPHWSDGYPLGLTCALGAALLNATSSPPSGNAGPALYVAGDRQIWRAPQYSMSSPGQYLDVSARVRSFVRKERPNQPGELTLELDNADGALTTAVLNGPISPNATRTLNEGYLVNGAPDTVTTSLYRLEQVLLVRSPDESLMRITARDPARWLKWQVRAMHAYANQTIGWLLTEIGARTNLPVAPLPTTAQVGEIVPSFIVPAGTTLAHALKELCAISDRYWLYDPQNGRTFRELNSGDGASWSYSSDWFALSIGWSGADDRATHIIITGKPLSPTQLCAAVNQDRIIHVANPRIATNVEASVQAGLMLADEQRAHSIYQLTVAGNPALQVLAVVTITDGALGLSYTVRITGTSPTKPGTLHAL